MQYSMSGMVNHPHQRQHPKMLACAQRQLLGEQWLLILILISTTDKVIAGFGLWFWSQEPCSIVSQVSQLSPWAFKGSEILQQAFVSQSTDNLNWQLYLHIHVTLLWAATTGLQDLLWLIRVLDTWGGWGASKAGNPPASFTYFNLYLFWNLWLPWITERSLGLGNLLRSLTKKKRGKKQKYTRL